MARRRLFAFVLGACSALLCLGVLELSAAWVYGRPGMRFGIEMWKYAKYVKVRSDDPEISHLHRPGAQAFLMGVDVRINSVGLRDREISVEKPAGTYRILVLGDSTTLGWGVPFDRLFTKLLERSLNANPPSPRYRRYEVLNGGVGNYNTAQEAAWFKAHGVRLNPDMVVVAWFINDAEPTPRLSRNWLASHSFAYVGIASTVDVLLRRIGVRPTYKDYYQSLYVASQTGWLKSQAAFAELRDLCRTRGMSMRILLIPELHTLGGRYEFAGVHDLIREVGRRTGTPVLDLLDAFPEAADPSKLWVSPGDSHPGGVANELMARKIDATLRSENWIR